MNFNRFKDGKEIRTDSNIKIQKETQRYESYSLTLNIAKGSDSGDYEVKVMNSMGEVTSKSRVIVQGKLNFLHFDHFNKFNGLKIGKTLLNDRKKCHRIFHVLTEKLFNERESRVLL